LRFQDKNKKSAISRKNRKRIGGFIILFIHLYGQMTWT
jgi:hypothetical protein